MPDAATSVRFADAARLLAEECRARGLASPSFRSPPSLPAADRTLRRRRDGGMVVAVRVRGRPMSAVLADLVEGVVAANGLGEEQGRALRRELLAVLEGTSAAAQAA